jgi:polar amino acid transport system substrate-binding protein
MNVRVFLTAAILCGLLAATGCTSAPQGPVPQPPVTVPAAPQHQYIVGVDAGFPPFTASDRAGNFSGFDIDAARRVAAREGFSVKFVAVPWSDIVPALENGTIDLIWSGMTVTAGREARVNFSVPYYTVRQSIAVRVGSPITLQDFTEGRLRIGAQAGSSEADWVTDNLIRPGRMPAENLTLFPDIATLTDNLENGGVDASLVQAPSQIRAIDGRPLVIIGSTPEQDRYAVAVRKTDPVLLATVNRGLTGLMRDPYWEQLKRDHGLE